MGLIGSIIAEGTAGAAEGIGIGTAKAGEKWTEALHEKAKQEAIAAREESLARINNTAAMERTQVGEAGATARNERTVGSHETLAKAQQDFQAEQNRLQRDLSREEIASREKVSAANNASALQIARIGGSVTQDTQGNVLWVGKDGKAQQIMDPSNPDKPLVGFKDLTPAAKAYADVIKAQLAGLDREELSAATMGDQAAAAKITERRAALNADLLNVLTGGIGSAGQKPAPTPGKTGWDSTTGKVYANGQEVGTAKTEAEARKMVEGSKKPAAPAAPASPGGASGGASTPAKPATRSPSDREFEPDLEAKDPQLRALRLGVSSANPNVSTDAWIKYAARVKELKG